MSFPNLKELWDSILDWWFESDPKPLWDYLLDKHISQYPNADEIRRNIKKYAKDNGMTEDELRTAKLVAPLLSDEKGNLKVYVKLINKEQNEREVNKEIYSNCQDVLCYIYPKQCGKDHGKMYYPNLLAELYNRFRVVDPEDINEDLQCQLLDLEYPSKKWIGKQNKYVDQLSPIDFKLLVLYSHNGDVFINNFLRDGKIITNKNLLYVRSRKSTFLPIIKDLGGSSTIVKEELQLFAEYFVKRVEKIIRRSPVLDKDIVLYRGLRTLPYKDEEKEVIGLKGFSSMSMSLQVAIDFARDRGYVEKVIVPKGSHLIFNYESKYPIELELLPPPNSLFRVLRECKWEKFFKMRMFDEIGYEIVSQRVCVTELLS